MPQTTAVLPHRITALPTVWVRELVVQVAGRKVEGEREEGRMEGWEGLEGWRCARRYEEGARVAMTGCGRVRACAGAGAGVAEGIVVIC